MSSQAAPSLHRGPHQGISLPAAQSIDPLTDAELAEVRRTESLLGAAARIYGVSGLHVFPVAPRGKTPLVKWGTLATTAERTMAAWWAQWPDANVGVALGPSGHVVVDVDPRNGGWESLAAIGFSLPESGTVATGGGGAHVWFTGSRPTRHGILPGIDVQGSGSYVVAPPSVHPNGQAYTWEGAGYLSDFAAWPEALDGIGVTPQPEPVEITKTPPVNDFSTYLRAAVRGELDRVLLAANGTRNHALNQASFALGQLVGSGALPWHQAETMLTQAGITVGLTSVEVRATVDSGLRAGMAQPRQGVTA